MLGFNDAARDVACCASHTCSDLFSFVLFVFFLRIIFFRSMLFFVSAEP
jgi:hypothetical protein